MNPSKSVRNIAKSHRYLPESRKGEEWDRPWTKKFLHQIYISIENKASRCSENATNKKSSTKWPTTFRNEANPEPIDVRGFANHTTKKWFPNTVLYRQSSIKKCNSSKPSSRFILCQPSDRAIKALRSKVKESELVSFKGFCKITAHRTNYMILTFSSTLPSFMKANLQELSERAASYFLT